MKKTAISLCFILMVASWSAVADLSESPESEEALGNPQITIIQREGETVEEYRVNGQLYMMKVTPEHGIPYYLHKEESDSEWRVVGPAPPSSIPKWVIFRF